MHPKTGVEKILLKKKIKISSKFNIIDTSPSVFNARRSSSRDSCVLVFVLWRIFLSPRTCLRVRNYLQVIFNALSETLCPDAMTDRLKTVPRTITVHLHQDDHIRRLLAVTFTIFIKIVDF